MSKKVIKAGHTAIFESGNLVKLNTVKRLVVINPTKEDVQIQLPVLNNEWIEEQKTRGLAVITLIKNDDYSNLDLQLYYEIKDRLEQKTCNDENLLQIYKHFKDQLEIKLF